MTIRDKKTGTTPTHAPTLVLFALALCLIVLGTGARNAPAATVTEIIDYQYYKNYQLKQADYSGSTASEFYSYDMMGNRLMAATDTTGGTSNTAPGAFGLTYPANLDQVSGETPFSWEAATDAGDTVVYYVYIGTDVNDLKLAWVGSDTSCLPFQLVNGASYYWQVMAKDSYGSVTTSDETWSFIWKEGDRPVTTITYPSAGEIIYGVTTMTVTGTANDGAGSGVTIVEVSMDNGEHWDEAVPSAPGDWSTWSYNFSATPGEYHVMIVATDGAGNVEAPHGITVTVDNSPVPTSIVSPANGAIITGSNYTISGILNGVGAEVDKVEVSTDGGIVWHGPEDGVNDQFVNAFINQKTDYTASTLPHSVISADFNSDGVLDLVFTSTPSTTTNGKVCVLLGNGDRTFGTQANFTVGKYPVSLASADFNKDGKLDLVTSNEYSNTLSLLMGNGNGTFGTAVPYATGTDPRYLTVADFNNDGWIDVAVANKGNNNVSVLANNLAGGLNARVDYTVGTGPIAIAPADFNGDGITDMAVTNFNNSNATSSISVLIANDTGGFVKHDYSVGKNPLSITANDLDNDGAADLAATIYNANTAPGSVAVLINRNDGTGAFNSYVSYDVGTGSCSVVSEDFNDDGYADLATANYGAGNISVLLNNKVGEFATFKANYTVGSGPTCVISGDFDGDGEFDLAAANHSANSISVIYGMPGWSYEWTLPEDGVYTLLSRSVSITGDIQNPPASVTVTVDNTDPVVDAGSDKTENSVFTQTATAIDLTAMTYEWTVQSAPQGGIVTFGSPGELATTVSANTDGSYTLRFTATDAAGHSAYSNMILTWDAATPSSSITYPSDSGTVPGGNCIITGSADGTGSGIEKVEVSVNNGAWQLATDKNPWSFSLTLNGSTTWNVRSRATDVAGNVENYGAGVYFSVDHVLGTISIDDTSYFGPSAEATVTVTDLDANINAGGGNDTLSVTITSPADTAGEMITLQEDAGEAGTFTGTFGFESFATFTGNGKVGVSKGGTVTVTYSDQTTPGGSPQDVLGAATWDCGRAMWVRNADSIVWDTNYITERADLFSFCVAPHGDSSNKVDTLYLDALEVVQSLNATKENDLRSFISEAHMEGIRVECLMGEPGWATSTSTATTAIGDVTVFNDASEVDKRFDGIHLDVQPYLLSGWDTENSTIWADYITMLGACQTSVNAYNSQGHDLTLAVDMPSDYDTDMVTYEATDPADVQDAVDYTVMLSKADEAFDIVEAVKDELVYAGTAGKKAVVGVDTSCTSNEVETFCEEGYNVMDSRLGIVASSFVNSASLIGFGINDYAGYTALPQLPVLPVSTITSPEPGQAIGNTSYKVKGNAFALDGIQKVEVYTSNTATWNLVSDTTGNGSWSAWEYIWSLPTAGQYTIKSRATDNSGSHLVEASLFDMPVTVKTISMDSLTANIASPQYEDASIMWTAKASGGSGGYTYHFDRKGPDTGGVYISQKSGSGTYKDTFTWTWNSVHSQGGPNNIKIVVKDAADQTAVNASTSYVIQFLVPVTADALTPDLVSPRVNGTPITWTATASGGSGNYTYHFDRKGPDTGGVYVVQQTTSPSNVWTWTPGANQVGTNYLKVVVHDTADGTNVSAFATYEVQ